jgi:phospholipid/cholesterol/gamma-HCH transport system substrate-binding protein
VINASQADTVANLQALVPILTRLSEAGDALPKALEMLVTYPFPRAATDAVKGDFTNLRITADLDLRTILKNIGSPDLPDLPPVPKPTGLPTGLPTSLPTGLPTGTSLPTSLPSVTVTAPTVPGVTSTPVVSPTCVTTICIGQAEPGSTRAGGALDTNLAAMMLGGLL